MKELVLTRVPPGDKWKDVKAGDGSPIVMDSLTEALNHIYNDPSQIINELPTNKDLLFDRLIDMKASGLLKTVSLNKEDKEMDKNIKNLLYILYLKDNVSYLVWYLLTGITVINISKGYLLNSTCEQNLVQMEEDYEDYLAEKAEEKEKRDDTQYNT